MSLSTFCACCQHAYPTNEDWCYEHGNCCSCCDCWSFAEGDREDLMSACIGTWPGVPRKYMSCLIWVHGVSSLGEMEDVLRGCDIGKPTDPPPAPRKRKRNDDD